LKLLEEEKKKAEEAKKAKAKPAVIAKSLLLFDVKPYEAETDLDALFQKILTIQMDGLFWKTECKKEPIAFGVHKLVVGCVIEDEKISVDDLQESIQAFEDEVQSVDIAIFNKL
jgi:elongation factor 1-beta